jgi:hypothetical protein
MPWTENEVATRLKEARDTLRRIPATQLSQLKAAWPQTVQDAVEVYCYTPPAVRLAPASAQAIDRMHEAFLWFRVLDDAPHVTRAAWLTAVCGLGPQRAATILGIHRDTARTRRNEALTRIGESLNRTERTPAEPLEAVWQRADEPANSVTGHYARLAES